MEQNGFHHRALELRETWPVVYTAISKHMFCYRVLITKFVLEQRKVPLNPFMNFDFGFFGLLSKDIVITANNNFIRMADELWAFGVVSDGGYAEILLAKERGIPIRYFQIAKNWEIFEVEEDEVVFEDEVLQR